MLLHAPLTRHRQFIRIAKKKQDRNEYMNTKRLVNCLVSNCEMAQAP